MKTLVEVTWEDAADGSMNTGDHEHLNPEDFIIERKSYGRIYKKNEHALVLITTEDANGIEYASIPTGWITNIKRYDERKYKKKV